MTAVRQLSRLFARAFCLAATVTVTAESVFAQTQAGSVYIQAGIMLPIQQGATTVSIMVPSGGSTKASTGMRHQSTRDTLRILETPEANLAKAERLWAAVQKRIPESIVFGANADYADACRKREDVVSALPGVEDSKLNSASLRPEPTVQLSQANT